MKEETMHEERSQRSQRTIGGFLLGVCCGAAVGAAVGVLFAPARGSDLRQQLSESTEQFRRQAAEKYGHASKVIADIASRSRSALARPSEDGGQESTRLAESS